MEKKQTQGLVWTGAAGRRIWMELVLWGAFLLFGILLNGGYTIKGFYMDDLYMMHCFEDQAFGEFVFPVPATKCRFIYYIFAYLQLAIMGTHMEWIVPMNLLLNAVIGYTVYRMGQRISGSRVLGVAIGFLYMLTRMSYYQITQFWGGMESLSLWAAIGILYCLYRYLNDKEKEHRWYLWTNVLYFTVCFIHERYMVLLALMVFALLVKKNKNRYDWLLTAGVTAVIQAIRFYVIGDLVPQGTGGTMVTETFHLKEAFQMAFEQVFYLFGINTGGQWLCGIRWVDTALWVKCLVICSILALAGLVGMFVWRIWKDKKERSSYMNNALLFILFIGACIGCSSITIRVEVRWVYVSITACWLFVAYMYRVISGTGRRADGIGGMVVPDYRRSLWAMGLFLAYAVLMLPVETYYRSYYYNLYFWQGQHRNNSLAEETYGRYGDDLFGKTIYILENSYGLSEFDAEGLFRSFHPEYEKDSMEVVFIDSIRDIGQVTDNMIILWEDVKKDEYQDVTAFVRDLKCKALYGYYEDGWMDEEAGIRVMAGAEGVIDLQFLYPGNRKGNETSAIKINGAPGKLVKIDNNMVYAQIQAEPYETVDLTFSNNFYLEDAQEQRGEKRFSMIVNVSVR